MTGPTRRRFLLIAAGAACSGLGWPWQSGAKSRVTWKGVSLGARAQIVIDHADRDAADDALAASRDEIERLEALFSLFRTDSAVARLNASGRLDAPAGDLLQVLSIAAAVHTASGGAFDPTVQRLWQAYARHFTQGDAESELSLHAALQNVGFTNVRFDADSVAFAHKDMALTLNGIAQGYITDRIAALLRARGFKHVLVDIGEIRAIGPRRDGRAWRVPIAGSSRTVGLRHRALATSSCLGTTFDDAGQVGHILDPLSGRPAGGRRQVTVLAPTAALADALSTALCVLPARAAADTLAAFPETRLVDEIA
jgi:thiamine biosynthesis lipoprotein